MNRLDVILVGGGLHNALVAAALGELHPDASLVLIERADALGLGHTWCFHDSDLAARAWSFVGPFVAERWSGYDVYFPNHARSLASGYSCISGESFRDALERRFARHANFRLELGHSAQAVTPNSVTLDDGRTLHAELVIDARGPERVDGEIAGYQKFVGLQLELDAPHDLARPVLMDARVEQSDGFRFFYTLPFASRRVLVEDTYFSDSAALDREHARAEILRYATQRGFRVARVLREEVGCLPLPARQAAPTLGAPLLAGYGGGWFHPTTGYSLPLAARFALALAERFASPARALPELEPLVRSHARQLRFASLLNRMLFQACPPAERFHVFERFYRLPTATIARFYALDTTAFDRARILCGRPPAGVSLRRAALSLGDLA